MRFPRVDSMLLQPFGVALLNRLARRAPQLRLATLVLCLMGSLFSLSWPTSKAARDVSGITIVTISAASFELAPVAPEAIVASFGVNLATTRAQATGDADPNTPGVQLPTTLGGTTVEVNGQRAGLFFVSSGQVNFVIPSTAPDGILSVVIRAGDGTVSTGTVEVVQVAPAIFTANANGRGVPAALAYRVKAGGTQTIEQISQFNSTSGRFITKPIDLSIDTDTVVLSLFATGLRYVDVPLRDVSVLMGGNQFAPSFVGAAPGLVGVDQVNISIPRSLIGKGIVSLSLAAAGFNTSNVVEIEIGGTASGPTGPQIAGFTVPEPIADKAVAGRMLKITGSGFSTTPASNKVYIGPSAAEAQVMSATATQLEVVVPYGVETGTIKVSTPLGEGVSADVLRIVTSISGVVENTNRQPLSGVTVSIPNTVYSAQTSNDGTFVLADVPAAGHTIVVQGSQIPVLPPYPTVSFKMTADANRDNKYTKAIALQQATGNSGTVGGSAPAANESLRVSRTNEEQQQQPTTVAIQTGSFSLQVPANSTVTFPDGSKTGTLYLTPLQAGRTPVELPQGVYSSSIVQITPFDVKLSPGAKLVFPNTDGFPSNTELRLYRYDKDAGIFLPVEGAKVTVSTDGKSIETGANDIKDTTYYFATTARRTTTVTGRVLCCYQPDGTTANNRAEPIGKAVVRLRGQEASTFGNGDYTLRFVPVTAGENVAVDITYIRPDGRVDRVQSKNTPVVLNGLTKVDDTLLPSASVNREPIILAPAKVEVPIGDTKDVILVIYDPDKDQQVNVSLSGPNWASISRVQGGGTSSNPNAYLLRLAPTGRAAETLTLSATDGKGGTAGANISVTTLDVNRAPTANSLDLSTDEDTPLAIKLTGSDPENSPLTYKVLTPPLWGGLSGTAPNLTYVPIANFSGSDLFTFQVNDGASSSLPATVKVTVRPVNDPPSLTVTAPASISEGQSLTINLMATDPDPGQKLTFSGTGLPTGSSLQDVSSNEQFSAQFKWTPTFTQAGTYTLVFKVTDNGTPALSDTKEVKLTVLDAATFSVPGPQSVNEGQQLLFDIALPNAQASSNVTASNLPTGATLTATAPGLWQFKWTPTFTQAGSYTITFRGTNNSLTEDKDVVVTVFDVQRELSKEGAGFTVLGANGPVPRNQLDAGEAVGTSLATGDLNGDGVADLAVGAPYANNGTQDAGRDVGAVYVFFGKAGLAGSLDLAQQKPDVTLYGERSYDSFGSSLAIADISGDGKADLIIGAPLADTTDKRDCGKVYAVFGAFPPAGLDANKSAVINLVTGLTINGGAISDKFGTSVAAGLFRARTGAADLLVGAPGTDFRDNSNSSDLPPLTDAGTVYLFAGGAALSKDRDVAKNPANYSLSGATNSAQFGTTLATGNFNGDDFMDFAVGAPLENKGAGVAYLIAGASSLSGNRTVGLTTVAFLLPGLGDGTNVGAALAFGDLNGDGYSDWLIGTPGADGTNAANRGEVKVIFGAAGILSRQMTIYGVGRRDDNVADALGSSLATGDFNGDGIADLVIGAPGADATTEVRDAQGAAYVIFGSRTALPTTYDLATRTADLTIYGTRSGDRLGQGALGFGNLNAADTTDLVVGAARSSSFNGSRTDAGEVRVLFGVRR